MIQEAEGINVWKKPFTTLRVPLFFDLQVDPYEKGDHGVGFEDWSYHRSYVLVPIQEAVGQALDTFEQFPPRQKPASFTVSNALEALSAPTGGK